MPSPKLSQKLDTFLRDQIKSRQAILRLLFEGISQAAKLVSSVGSLAGKRKAAKEERSNIQEILAVMKNR